MATNLNVKQLKSLVKKAVPGRYSIGNGLYFRISNEGSGFWVVRYSIHQKRREITIGIQKIFREKKVSVEHFTVHDLRRTCRSLLVAEGIPGHVAERCLNHKLKGVEGIYDRYDYFEERFEALNKIAQKLAPLINSI